jgi:hypothetical protein
MQARYFRSSAEEQSDPVRAELLRLVRQRSARLAVRSQCYVSISLATAHAASPGHI